MTHLSANCDVIVIFPIYSQFRPIRKPDFGRKVCKTYIFINSNLLSNKNCKQNQNISNIALIILFWVMAKWLSVHLRIKWLWVRVQLQSLKPLSKEFLPIPTTIECRFTLKRICDMTNTYSKSTGTITAIKCWFFAEKCWHQQNWESLGTKIYTFWNYICVCTYVPNFKFLAKF